MSQNPNQHSVRKIVLPSGKSIEVVRFNENDASTHRGLHICPECDSHLVQPIAWAESTDDRWELTLNCPNCRWTGEGVFVAEAVQELEERLDEGLAEMLRDLQRLTQANMAEHVERFVAALHADLILPEDF